MSKFHFVDFAARYQRGFRNHVIPIEEVPARIEHFKRYGCYSTYFLYSDDILTHMGATEAGHAPSVAGYTGKVWASRFPIDLDHADLNVALEVARWFLTFFLDVWVVDPSCIDVYFSGSKGFHLMLDTRVFGGIAPSKTLPLMFSAMRWHLAQRLPEAQREVMDLTIKDRVRLLRLPNTIHERSGLFKIILSVDEIRNAGSQEIRKLAQAIRPLPHTDETGLVSKGAARESGAARQFFLRIQRQMRRATRKPFEDRFRRRLESTDVKFACAGLQRIWEKNVGHGYRNNCAIRLASEFRLMGLSETETREKIFEWNQRNGIGLPDQEVDSVIHSAFQHRFPYRYGCMDPIRRMFCPFPNYAACERFISDSSTTIERESRKSR
jgi:hypothetical protein